MKSELPQDFPKFTKIMWLCLESLKEFGGSAHRKDICEMVFEMSGCSQECLEIKTDKYGEGGRFYYDIGWGLSLLKKMNMLDNDTQSRGVWTLQQNGNNLTENQIFELYEEYKKSQTRLRKLAPDASEGNSEEDIDRNLGAEEWKDELLNLILKAITPEKFEHLVKQLLVKMGLQSPEVTSYSNDNGIDITGILVDDNFVRLRVAVQCKLYSRANSVGKPDIQKLRGALKNEYNLGYFITTSYFSKGAIKEADSDSSRPIALIDGERLCQLLLENELGVKKIEIGDVNYAFFNDFANQK